MDATDAAKISQLVTKWIAQDPQMKEANVKLRIVQPLLEVLGWDAAAGDVEMERSLKIGSNKVSVDFALLVEGKVAAFVEAKSLDTNLGDEDAEQVISYGRVANVRWCALTNGRELRVYDSSERGTPGDCLVSEVVLRELPSKSGELRIMEKDAILTQEVDDAIRLRRALKTAAQRFGDSRTEAVAAIGGVLKPFLNELPDQQLTALAEKGFATVQSEIQRLMSPRQESQVAPSGLQGRGGRAVQASAIQVVARKNLVGDPNATVIVCPARPTPGVTFLLRYQAWGYVRANRPAKYLGLYVSQPHSAVLYFGEVDTITPPLASRSAVYGIDDADLASFEPGKRVVWLKLGTLVKLSDPIPSTSPYGHPQNARYTSLGKFKVAKDTSELWGNRV